MPKPTDPRSLEPTPGQTVGPFFAFGLEYPRMHQVVPPHSPGAVALEGTIYDGAGAPIPDAVVEIWGAAPDGSVPRSRGALRRDDRTFTGFGRSATDDDGHYRFWTLEPGAEPGRAAMFAVVVFARGLPDKLHTRIYLPGDTETLGTDRLLASLAPDVRETLIARRAPDGGLHHDIHLQGEKETVFLAF